MLPLMILFVSLALMPTVFAMYIAPNRLSMRKLGPTQSPTLGGPVLRRIKANRSRPRAMVSPYQSGVDYPSSATQILHIADGVDQIIDSPPLLIKAYAAVVWGPSNATRKSVPVLEAMVIPTTSWSNTASNCNLCAASMDFYATAHAHCNFKTKWHSAMYTTIAECMANYKSV